MSINSLPVAKDDVLDEDLMIAVFNTKTDKEQEQEVQVPIKKVAPFIGGSSESTSFDNTDTIFEGKNLQSVLVEVSSYLYPLVGSGGMSDNPDIIDPEITAQSFRNQIWLDLEDGDDAQAVIGRPDKPYRTEGALMSDVIGNSAASNFERTVTVNVVNLENNVLVPRHNPSGSTLWSTESRIHIIWKITDAESSDEIAPKPCLVQPEFVYPGSINLRPSRKNIVHTIFAPGREVEMDNGSTIDLYVHQLNIVADILQYRSMRGFDSIINVDCDQVRSVSTSTRALLEVDRIGSLFGNNPDGTSVLKMKARIATGLRISFSPEFSEYVFDQVIDSCFDVDNSTTRFVPANGNFKCKARMSYRSDTTDKFSLGDESSNTANGRVTLEIGRLETFNQAGSSVPTELSTSLLGLILKDINFVNGLSSGGSNLWGNQCRVFFDNCKIQTQAAFAGLSSNGDTDQAVSWRSCWFIGADTQVFTALDYVLNGNRSQSGVSGTAPGVVVTDSNLPNYIIEVNGI